MGKTAFFEDSVLYQKRILHNKKPCFSGPLELRILPLNPCKSYQNSKKNHLNLDWDLPKAVHLVFPLLSVSSSIDKAPKAAPSASLPSTNFFEDNQLLGELS